LVAYVVRRLLHVVPVLLGVSVVVFLTMKLVPGDQAEALLGPQAPEGIAQIRHSLGLDQPVYVQYARWLWLVLRGDFGFSWNLGIVCIVSGGNIDAGCLARILDGHPP
jgi:peptide/nickel transport system permease protein